MDQIGDMITGAAGHVGNALNAAAQTAQAAGGNGMGYGFLLGSKFAGTVDGAYRGIDRNLFKLFMNIGVEEGADEEAGAPVVEGGDFGSLKKESKQDPVILRVEVAQPWEMKIAKIISTIFSLLIAGFIIALLVIKVNLNWTSDEKYFTGNLAVVCVFEAILLWALFKFCKRLYEVRRYKLQWSRRRLYICSCAFSVLILQTINCAMMLASMAILVENPCKYRNKVSAFLGLLQWTCWNTSFSVLLVMSHNLCILRRVKKEHRGSSKRVRGTQLVMDAPVTVHKLKILLWIFFEVWIILSFWSAWDFYSDGCYPTKAECILSSKTKAFMSLIIFSAGLNLIIYWFYSSRANIDIESKSYAEMKFVRVIFGLQHSYVFPLFLVLVLSMILMTAIQLDSCWTYAELWLGVAPLQAAGTCSAITIAYFFIPKPGRGQNLLNALLQEFSWTEDQKLDCMAARNEILHLCSSEKLATQSIFSVEMAIRLMYLANHVYMYGGEESNKEECVEKIGWGNLKEALSLMGATSSEIVVEPSSDTLALVAKSENVLVISFRGTSSKENVKTDLDFVKVLHEPSRKVPIFSGLKGLREVYSRPFVHRGFYKSWTGNGFNSRIMDRMIEFIENSESQPAKVYLTGHSLGGALASLCAIDIMNAYDDRRDALDLTVYTYGQPRVGNKAFGMDYNNKVTNHFSVVNDQDPVSRIPKGNYKRNGSRVIINQNGDLIAEPTALEMHTLMGQSRIKDHFIEGYRKALMCIIKSQFGPKYVSGILESGRDGATHLSSTLDLNKVLMGIGLDLESLQDHRILPQTDEEVEKSKKKHVGTLEDKPNTGFGPHLQRIVCCGHNQQVNHD